MVTRQNLPLSAVPEVLPIAEGNLPSGGVDLDKVQGALARGERIAFGLPFRIPGVPVPSGGLPGLIENALQRDKGPYAQQAALFDKMLTDGGRPRGNTSALSIGKDDAGNNYSLTRTNTGVEISVGTGAGATYRLEVGGGGAVKKATYVGADGIEKPVSPTTVNKMISTALLLGQRATTAPDLPGTPTGQPEPATKPAPEL